MPFTPTANVDPGALADGVTPELVRYAFGRLGREIDATRVAAVVALVEEHGDFAGALRWAYSHTIERRALDVRAVSAGLFEAMDLRVHSLRDAAQFNTDPARRHDARARLAVIAATTAGAQAVAA